jgi:hypothetical protein
MADRSAEMWQCAQLLAINAASVQFRNQIARFEPAAGENDDNPIVRPNLTLLHKFVQQCHSGRRCWLDVNPVSRQTQMGVHNGFLRD